MFHRTLIALILSSSFLVACQQARSEETRQEQTKSASTGAAAANTAPDPAAEARSLYRGRCSACHGQQGGGDGPGAAALNPKPRAFHDAEWQASVGDEQLAKVIVQGGAATGKSPSMPGNPDLQGKPEVVTALIGMIRGFKK